MLDMVQRMSLAYLKSQLYGEDKSWAMATCLWGLSDYDGSWICRGKVLVEAK